MNGTKCIECQRIKNVNDSEDVLRDGPDVTDVGAATAAEDVEVGRVRRPQVGQQLPEEVRVSLVESLRSVQLIVAQRGRVCPDSANASVPRIIGFIFVAS